MVERRVDDGVCSLGPFAQSVEIVEITFEDRGSSRRQRLFALI